MSTRFVSTNRTASMRLLAAALVFAAALRPAAAAPDLVLLYDHPATDTDAGWEREALPIGNGRIGAMVFGQPGREHLQFNDITLWTGDSRTMGAYQAFGDLFVDLPGHAQGVSNYRRTLDIEHGLHTVSYVRDGVAFRRETWASFPAQVIVLRLSADKPAQYSGTIALTDRHGARLTASGHRLYATGTLAGYTLPNAPPGTPPTSNVMDYASQVEVINEGGTLAVEDGKLRFTGCDALTLVLGAGTSYVLDAARGFQGAHPLARVGAQVDAAAARAPGELLAEHERDVASLIDRVRLDLGQAAPERRALGT